MGNVIEQHTSQFDRGLEVPYRIAHIVPGRTRFRVPRLTNDPGYAQRLQELIESEAPVTGVRVNRVAASIVITYKTGMVSDNEMRSHLIELIQSARNAVVPTRSAQRTADREIANPKIDLRPRIQSKASRLSVQPVALACSLEVRQATTSSDCGLLKNRAGEPLKGGALKARIRKLHRLGILI